MVRGRGAPRRARAALAAAVSALALASCGGSPPLTGDSTTLPPTTAVPSTVVSTTSRPPATTSSPTVTTTTAPPPTTTTTSLPPSTTTTMPAWWREATAEAPLRVWVIGDSLAGPVGSALSGLARESGRFRVSVHGEGGTGLASPAYFDWPEFVSAGIADAAPEAVVVILGANDAQDMPFEGQSLVFATPEWDTRYRDLVGGFMDQLLGSARRVYWLEVPIMEGPSYNARMRHVSALLRWEASLRLTVRFVGIYDLLQAPGGGFAFDLPGPDGGLTTVRDADGIHYTAAGAGLVAGQLLAVLERDWPAESE